MRVGTPGFVGMRLREARESRQMTGTALAELVGVSTGGISAYERGHTSPSPEVMDRICKALNFKMAFFTRPLDSEGLAGVEQTVFERSRMSATKSTRRRARHHRTWLREIVKYLSRLVRLPEPNIPKFRYISDWLAISDEDIESSARDTRRQWKLGDGPISNVTLLAERNGVIMTMMAMNARNLDAFSTWDDVDGRPYIVLGSDTQSAFRTRFNVCHELGHLILHSEISPSEFQDQSNFKVIESQANRFAAAFLTPATSFSPDVAMPSLEVFRSLKHRWLVSIKMMIHRAHELDIVDREEARRLYINYNRRRWNQSEPLDEDYPLEEPRLVRRAFEAVIDKTVIERSQIKTELPFNPDDIENLACLPYGYLDDDSAYSWAIRELGSGFGKTA